MKLKCTAKLLPETGIRKYYNLCSNVLGNEMDAKRYYQPSDVKIFSTCKTILFCYFNSH